MGGSSAKRVDQTYADPETHLFSERGLIILKHSGVGFCTEIN